MANEGILSPLFRSKFGEMSTKQTQILNFLTQKQLKITFFYETLQKFPYLTRARAARDSGKIAILRVNFLY